MKANSIICGDCLEVMKDWPDNCVDLVLTDPPFNVSLEYNAIGDDLDDEDYSEWCKKWLLECNRILKPRHYAIIFSGDKKLFWVHKGVMGSGLQFHHFLKWHKPLCQRALSGSVLFCRTELAFLCSCEKPDTKIINRKIVYQDTIVCDNTTGRDEFAVDHPARRPVPLYQQLIEGFTSKGDVVCDIFMGSGTTAVASILSGRQYIGCEIDSQYIELQKEVIQGWAAGVPVKEQRAGQMALFENNNKLKE